MYFQKKNSSNHIFAFLANFFFQFWRLLIGWDSDESVNQWEASIIQKSWPKRQKIWFDEVFFKYYPT